jgi:hypothetical protein
VSEEFVNMEIVKNENGQYLKLVKEDGTKEVYFLKDFPYRRGGPVITGEYEIEFKKEE